MLCQHADYNLLGEKTARWSPTLGEHLGDGEFREETLLCMGGDPCSWSMKMETLVLGLREWRLLFLVLEDGDPCSWSWWIMVKRSPSHILERGQLNGNKE